MKWRSGQVRSMDSAKKIKLGWVKSGFLKKWGYTSLFKCWGKNSSVKGCVNDVSECRYNCRRNGLKEMRWNRIKRTGSRMTGKDAFRDFCLREWREGCERVYVAGKRCLTVCGVENCAVRFVILLMKNVAKSSAVRVDEGGVGGGQRREKMF